MIRKLLFFYFISTALQLFGSKIESAYEALSIYDYFKAKKLFYSQLQKSHKTAATYGLATIYFRADNPFSNTDSASKYITLSGNYYKSNRIQESYFNFKIDSIEIQKLTDSIASNCLNAALNSNIASKLELFIINNPLASLPFKLAALKQRDRICFTINQQYSKSDSTSAFLIRYPESNYYKELKTLLDKQLFEENTAPKTSNCYIEFISRFPVNKFVPLAQDQLFLIYKRNNDVQGLEFFVHNYPLSRFYNEAWKLLYALTVKYYNNEELQNFMKAYPEFPFKASINKEIELNNKLLIPLNDSDFVGYIDTTGEFVIPAYYEAATTFKEGVAVVNRNDSAWFINKENVNVFGLYYTEAYPFYNGIAPVNKAGQWFLINRQGQEIAGPFDDLSEQSEQVYVIKINNQYGAIDIYGNYIIKPQFDKMGDFKNGKAYYVSNGYYGFVNKDGTTFKARFQWISDFDENNIAIVKLNNLYGLVNATDSLFLNARYDLILKADNSNFILVRNNKYGFYSSKNCFVTDIDNDFKKEASPSYYTNGKLFKLIKYKKQAVMDANGRISIEFGQFNEVYFAQNNLIRVKQNNKFGFADRKLNMVIPARFVDASDFKDSLCICKTNTETVLINTTGNTIIKTKGQITRLPGGLFYIEEESGNKLTDRKGNVFFENILAYHISNINQNDNSGEYLILSLVNNLNKVIKL